MKKTTLITFAMLVAIATGFVSCEQKGDSKFDGYEKTDDGLYYKFHVKGNETVKPQVGDYLTIDMIYGTEDSVFFNSKDIPQAMKLPMIDPVFQGDIYEGMSLMSIGDSATFICNADSVFTKLFRMSALPPGLDTIKNLYFTIKMNNIQNEEEFKKSQEAELEQMKAQESIQRNDYLAENYPDAQPVASGLYFIDTKEGTGSSPQSGQKVKVHYKGMLLDGTVFDSSYERGQPFEFTLGQGQVIKGWDEGIAMMRKGGKAVLILPSEIAYGTRGGGSIPPYSTLVFEVELIDIE